MENDNVLRIVTANVKLTRQPRLEARYGAGRPEFEGTGRWVEVDLATPAGTLTVVSAYVHTGEAAGTPRQDEKYRFLDAMTARMAELRGHGDRLAVVMGALNVAHREADLKNWKGQPEEVRFLAPARRARRQGGRRPGRVVRGATMPPSSSTTRCDGAGEPHCTRCAAGMPRGIRGAQ